jgi:Tfp pilus assembly protein PilZ
MAARQFGAKPEARRAVRRLVDLECDVYCELWGEPLAHRVTDVSEDGLWIQTELLLEVGTEVTLTFLPPDWDEPLCVAGQVQRVELRSRPNDGGGVGMGIGFEAMRSDESMRCLRARESFILSQRTLTGVPVGIAEPEQPAAPEQMRETMAGWAAPTPEPGRTGRPSRVTVTPAKRACGSARPRVAFAGGLDLAASVFAVDSYD